MDVVGEIDRVGMGDVEGAGVEGAGVGSMLRHVQPEQSQEYCDSSWLHVCVWVRAFAQAYNHE